MADEERVPADAGVRPAGPGDGALRVDFERVLPLLPSLIDSLVDAVLVVDRQQRIVAANRRYVEKFGTDRPQIAGASCRAVLHCPEAPGDPDVGCVACEVLGTRRPARRIRNLPDGQGGLSRWEGMFNPIFDAAGEVSHVVEVWRDITERGQLEAQISHNERLAAVGILAAGVGHEINNPLASVMAGIESLLRWLDRREFEEAELAEAREVLETIEHAVTRCRETTDKLRLLGQPVSVAASWVDLNQAVRDTLSLIRHEARRTGVEIVEELDPAVAPIWARDTGVRSVIVNLAMNAIQAMPKGGRLAVRTQARPGGVILTVEDTGTGIPTMILDRIWDPFFTTKPVGKGTGLGLSISHRIIVRHGGSIRAENLPGGARFVVELPVDGPGGTDV